jgi:hypothetical protein
MKGVVARLDIPLVFQIKVGRHLLKILHFLNTRKMRQNLLIECNIPANSIGNGAAWLRMVRRGSVWCGVALHGAPWLSLMVRRGSEWCGVAQFMVRRGSVGSASACCKADLSSILGSAPQGGFSY